jgi:flavin reductase (DIM6/NTAB) family NADH-FMN oxidoreductase RutF
VRGIFAKREERIGCLPEKTSEVRHGFVSSATFEVVPPRLAANTEQIDMRRPLDLNIAYRIIGPGPVVLVSSLYNGRPAITPIAWHMPVSDSPPIVALEIWKDHFVYKAVLQTGDFVINIPSSGMADVVRKLGSVSGRICDKFRKFGLAKETSKRIKSPRLAASIGILECKLRRDKHLLDKYSVVLGDVVYAEAEKGLFSDRWLPESKGAGIFHHLGGRIFYEPAGRVI